MTKIVWLMYLADLTQSVSAALVLGGIITLVTVGAYKFARALDDLDSVPVRNYLIAATGALAVACLLPSKTTIYAAAAVTAGGEALKSPAGEKAVRALNAWLDRQIEGEKK